MAHPRDACPPATHRPRRPLPAPPLPRRPMDRPPTRVAVVTPAKAVGWSAAQSLVFVGSVLGLLSLFVTGV